MLGDSIVYVISKGCEHLRQGHGTFVEPWGSGPTEMIARGVWAPRHT